VDEGARVEEGSRDVRVSAQRRHIVCNVHGPARSRREPKSAVT
jgi:hypothetical protein